MVAMAGKNSKGIDLSIMPTLECNLKCSFCMYNCSPDTKKQIDFKKLKFFLSTVPKEAVNIFGLYGGEPSLNIPLYKKVIDLLPLDIPKFTITNGTWLKYLVGVDFVQFTIENNIHCYISSTPEHLPFQDTYVLKNLLRSYNNFEVKEDDTQKRMLPMGRNANSDSKYIDPYCTMKCIGLNSPERLAVMPDGSIIYQSCDGVYPVVGSIDEPFNLKKYSKKIKKCQFERI